MDPQLGLAGLRLAMFVFISALVLLFFEKSGSAEYYVTEFTLIIGFIFIVVIAFLVRRSSW